MPAFENELLALVQSDPDVTFDPVTGVTVSADGKTRTIRYGYHGYNLQAIVNWQSGAAAVSEIAGGNVWASGIGISPNLLQRGADARLEIMSSVTASNDLTNDVGFMISPHSERDGEPLAPGAELHPVAGGSSFIVDLMAGALSDDMSSWDRLGVFRITAMDAARTKVKIEKLELNDDNEWTATQQLYLSLDECTSLLRIFGNMVTEARGRGWSLVDSTSTPNDVFGEFTVKDASGASIAYITKDGQGKFKLKVLAHSIQMQGGTTVAVLELDFSDIKPLRGAERVFETIAKARAFFTDLAQKGCSITGLTLDSAKLASSQGYELRLKGTLVLPAGLGMSSDPGKQVLFEFYPSVNEFRAGTVSDTWLSRDLPGGVQALVNAIQSFKDRFPSAGPLELKVGKQSRLLVTGAAAGANFGGSLVLDTSISARLELDITSQLAGKIPMGLAMCIGISGSFTSAGSSAILNLAPTKLTQPRLQALVRVLNKVATSGIPITVIAASIDTAAGEEYDSGGDPLVFEIRFGSGVSSWFRVGDVNTVLSLIVNKVNAVRGGAAWQYPLQMMPSQYLATMLDFYRARERCESFHTVYLDGSNNEFKADGKTSNEQGVRFDQWLIHHLLGDSYDAAVMQARVTDATYKAKLKAACDLAGIATDASGWPIQSLENDINNVLPWFLLYTAQAGNTEKTPAGMPVSFLGWLAAQGVADITQLAPAQLVTLMQEYGLAPGPGFIDIPIRNLAA